MVGDRSWPEGDSRREHAIISPTDPKETYVAYAKPCSLSMSELAVFLVLLAQFDPAITFYCQIDAFSKERQAEFKRIEVEGTYRSSFEVRSFTPIGSNESWWVSTRALKDLMAERNATKLRIVIRGMLSPEGRYGHVRRYSRCLANPEVVKVLGPPSEG